MLRIMLQRSSFKHLLQVLLTAFSTAKNILDGMLHGYTLLSHVLPASCSSFLG
jgi:hypothetical protein